MLYCQSFLVTKDRVLLCKENINTLADVLINVCALRRGVG